MALVVPFIFLFGFDGLPVQTIDPSTNTHEQDVSEYGCLTKWKMNRNKANNKKNWTEMKQVFFFPQRLNKSRRWYERKHKVEQKHQIMFTFLQTYL